MEQNSVFSIICESCISSHTGEENNTNNKQARNTSPYPHEAVKADHLDNLGRTAQIHMEQLQFPHATADPVTLEDIVIVPASATVGAEGRILRVILTWGLVRTAIRRGGTTGQFVFHIEHRLVHCGVLDVCGGRRGPAAGVLFQLCLVLEGLQAAKLRFQS